MSDIEKILLGKAKSGDVAAFESLIETYQKKIFNLAFQMLGNREDAFEMAQEALMRIYRSLPAFKEESSFSTWIYRITMNVCTDHLRKNKGKNTISMDEDISTEDGNVRMQLVDQAPQPQALLERNEIRRAVRESICSLPEDYRIVIILRDVQGFSYEEISKMIGCPEGTVKSRINRARHLLRDVLKKKKELFDSDNVKYLGKEG